MAEEAPNVTPIREKHLPIGRWIVLAVLGFGVYAWTWGPYGILHQRSVAHHIEDMRRQNDSLRLLTRRLGVQLQRIGSDSTEITRAARRAGLTRPGEILVRFIDTTRP